VPSVLTGLPRKGASLKVTPTEKPERYTGETDAASLFPFTFAFVAEHHSHVVWRKCGKARTDQEQTDTDERCQGDKGDTSTKRHRSSDELVIQLQPFKGTSVLAIRSRFFLADKLTPGSA
jgi:hypothetical protein